MGDISTPDDSRENEINAVIQTRSINGITYGYVDGEAGLDALDAFFRDNEMVYWITLTPFEEGYIEVIQTHTDHIQQCFIASEDADGFEEFFEKHSVTYTTSFDLETAVTQAHKIAQADRGHPGDAGIVIFWALPPKDEEGARDEKHLAKHIKSFEKLVKKLPEDMDEKEGK